MNANVVFHILPDVTYLPENMVSPIIILRLGHVKSKCKRSNYEALQDCTQRQKGFLD